MAAAAAEAGASGAKKRPRIMRDDDLTNVEFETSEDVEVVPTFDKMGLREPLIRGIYSYGWFFLLGF